MVVTSSAYSGFPMWNNVPTTEPYGNSYNTTGYKSSFGNLYQYDLNKLTDRNRYSIDLGAQRRDQLNPWKSLERGMGQYGGGRYNY